MKKVWLFVVIFVAAALVLVTFSSKGRCFITVKERPKYSYETVVMDDGLVTFSSKGGCYMTVQVVKEGGIWSEVSTQINTNCFEGYEDAATTWAQPLPRSVVFHALRPNFTTAYLPEIDGKGLDTDSVVFRITNGKWQRTTK